MSHENFLSHRIKCDYPDCGKPCDDWWNDQWLTLVKYGVHGRMGPITGVPVTVTVLRVKCCMR